jgi:hypothetical protein
MADAAKLACCCCAAVWASLSFCAGLLQHGQLYSYTGALLGEPPYLVTRASSRSVYKLARDCLAVRDCVLHQHTSSLCSQQQQMVRLCNMCWQEQAEDAVMLVTTGCCHQFCDACASRACRATAECPVCGAPCGTEGSYQHVGGQHLEADKNSLIGRSLTNIICALQRGLQASETQQSLYNQQAEMQRKSLVNENTQLRQQLKQTQDQLSALRREHEGLVVQLSQQLDTLRVKNEDAMRQACVLQAQLNDKQRQVVGLLRSVSHPIQACVCARVWYGAYEEAAITDRTAAAVGLLALQVNKLKLERDNLSFLAAAAATSSSSSSVFANAGVSTHATALWLPPPLPPRQRTQGEGGTAGDGGSSAPSAFTQKIGARQSFSAQQQQLMPPPPPSNNK